MDFKARLYSLIHTWKRCMWCTFPEIHLWCDNCQPLCGQYGSQSLSPYMSFSRGRTPNLIWGTSHIAVQCANQYLRILFIWPWSQKATFGYHWITSSEVCFSHLNPSTNVIMQHVLQWWMGLSINWVNINLKCHCDIILLFMFIRINKFYIILICDMA